MTSSEPNYAALKAAISPDFHSRSAYVGRVVQTEDVIIIGEDGTPFETKVSFLISWETIQKILGLVQNRAGITKQ